ncbi:hypothetical protein [Pseudomonas sp. nanlin1]|uniref:hypothetical protein n=1 Tax=Pseudomonas sp. nanlin1 TaxID=3040605 RepID=UPI00388D22C8
MTFESPEISESPEALKARKLVQLNSLLEAMGSETRDLSKAFYHGWILSAAMELWDRGVLSQEERQAFEVKANAAANGAAAEPQGSD